MSNENKERRTGGGMCPTGEILERLAIRLLERAEQRGPSEQGPPGGLPGDLFAEGEEWVREHLDRCLRCRNRLYGQLCSEYRIREAFCDPANESRFRKTVRGAVFEDESAGGDVPIAETMLLFDPYPEVEGGGVLAAATPGAGPYPIRYSSEDKAMVLRQFTTSGADRGRFLLMCDDQWKIRRAEIVIGGQSYRTDESGLIEFPPDLDLSSIGRSVLVRSRRS